MIRLSAPTRTILAGIVLCGVLPALAVRALGWTPGYWSTLHWVFGHDGGDSWDPIRAALVYLDQFGPNGLYQATYYNADHQFQYSPLSLVLFRLIDRLPGIDVTARASMNQVSWYVVAVTALVAGAIAVSASAAFGRAVACAGGADRVVRFTAAALATLLYFPVVSAYSHGNIQSWLNLLLIFSLLAWMWQWRIGVGVALGLYCVVKPSLAPILLWLLWRREWRALAGAGAVVGVLGAASLWSYGWQIHLDYLELLRFLSGRGESYLSNQSVHGLLLRMFSLGPNLEYDGSHTHIVHNAWVDAAAAAGVLAFLLPAFWAARRAGPAGSMTDYCIGLVSCLISSSIVYDHYYGVTLAVVLLVAAVLATDRARAAWELPVLALACIACGNVISGTRLLADTPWNFLQSYMLFGALGLLVLLHRQRLRLAAAVPAGCR